MDHALRRAGVRLPRRDGAYLYGRKVNDTKKLASFLVTRGLWLVFLELTVIRVAWTFNFDFAHYMLAGVIWMIGWCMVLMAGIVFLPRAAILTGSLLVIFGHNTGVLQHLLSSGGEENANPIAKILYLGGGFQLGARRAAAAHSVRAHSVDRRDGGGLRVRSNHGAPAGAPSSACASDSGSPRSRSFSWCAARIATAISVAGIGRPSPAQTNQAPAAQTSRHAPRPQMPLALAFLNTSKYPASLSFLLMTLGPMLVLLGLVDQAHGPIARALETFGRVPMFYYLLHIPTIHLAAVIVSLVREGSVNPWLFANHPARPGPAAARLHVEPAAAVPRVGDRDRRAVRRVPLVRRSEVAQPVEVAELSVGRSLPLRPRTPCPET